jgi:hypothetical protein
LVSAGVFHDVLPPEATLDPTPLLVTVVPAVTSVNVNTPCTVPPSGAVTRAEKVGVVDVVYTAEGEDALG